MDIRHPTLEDAFVEDHRKMTMGFFRLRQSLEAADWTATRQLAADIDRDAGPHIEFEETIYYPRLEPLIGAGNVRRMYEEHRIGLGLIRDILARGDEVPDETARYCLADQCRQMLDHAQSCGTLISHLSALPPAEQRDLLGELEAIRDLGVRWTEFASRKQSGHRETRTP